MNSVLLTIAKVQASATLILGRTFLWCGLFCTVPSVSKGFYRCTRSYLWVFRAELPSANLSDALSGMLIKSPVFASGKRRFVECQTSLSTFHHCMNFLCADDIV